mmetsp:Transcript_34851/g.93112  ORF Transcript_34851/g.93112 Transcript_34851/m.93112 type:complete len:172 (+) Transcript_34851:292-807(+)
MAAAHAPGPASPRTAAMPPPPPRDGSSSPPTAPTNAKPALSAEKGSGAPPAEEGGPGPAVGDMVSKAKKLAGQMWCLLHAKACTNAECTVYGCAQTKGLFRIMHAEEKLGYKVPTHGAHARVVCVCCCASAALRVGVGGGTRAFVYSLVSPSSTTLRPRHTGPPSAACGGR